MLLTKQEILHIWRLARRGVTKTDIKHAASQRVRDRLGVSRLPSGYPAAIASAIDNAQRARIATQPSLRERLYASLITRYVDEIERRGGEIEIVGEYERVGLSITDRAGGLALLAAEGWRQYSRRFGARRASLAYLCGLDDNGPWALRVPGTLETVADAAAWVEPAVVRRARERGAQILRQGDIYAIETRRDRAARDAAALPDSHEFDPVDRVLHHRPADGRTHAPMAVPFPARLVAQRVYQMGRGARRGRGD